MVGEYENYSVLMSVYHKEKPAFLAASIESMASQTVPTNDFVLVCDGPLTEELDAVIASKMKTMAGVLHIVHLEKNSGLGNALNEGLKHCRNEIVARMDSDDISYPDRCERQLTVFRAHPEISICSGTVEEFSEKPEIVTARRVVPETNDEILKFAEMRSPFNHPCVMYKKSAVEEVGSYMDFPFMEDYYLWIRMLIAGCQGYNIQEPLLHMRAGAGMYKRRSGWAYVKTQLKMVSYLRKIGFISRSKCIECYLLRTGSALAPNWIRTMIFKKVLRK